MDHKNNFSSCHIKSEVIFKPEQSRNIQEETTLDLLGDPLARHWIKNYICPSFPETFTQKAGSNRFYKSPGFSSVNFQNRSILGKTIFIYIYIIVQHCDMDRHKNTSTLQPIDATSQKASSLLFVRLFANCMCNCVIRPPRPPEKEG